MTDAKANTYSNSWTLRLFTLMIWLAVGLCVAYWAFKFITTKPVEATAALPAPALVIDSKAVAKLLGAADNVAAKPVNVAVSTKYALFGLAGTARGQGVALIALDGKPAKPYRVGSVVADSLILKSISNTGVILAASITAADGVTLELPVRKPVNIVSIVPRHTGPNVVNSTDPATFNPIMPRVQSPNVPPVAVVSGAAAITTGPAAGTASLVDRSAPSSRFTSQMGDGMVPSRVPATSSTLAERN